MPMLSTSAEKDEHCCSFDFCRNQYRILCAALVIVFYFEKPPENVSVYFARRLVEEYMGRITLFVWKKYFLQPAG